MKALLRMAAVLVATLTLIAGVVFGLGDDETLVSPPDVVAKSFVEALGHGRPATARGLLTQRAERSASREAVANASRRLRSRIGDLESVEATVQNRRRNRATVRVEIEGTRMQIALVLPLARESGVWKIQDLGDALTMVARGPRPARTP